MTGQFEVKTEPLVSMNELVLRVVIRDGDRSFDQFIPASSANNDRIIKLCEEMATFTGKNLADIEQQMANEVSRARKWWEQKQVQVQGGFQGNFLTSDALAKLEARHQWLIKNVLVRDQPTLIGGPKKSMKTTIMIDAALSLGSGEAFLGKFEIPERVRVAVLSGESGQITIRETALRIAKSKGVELSACDVLWGFDLPRLGVAGDLDVLQTALKNNGIKVVFIDPAYLCLLAGSPELQASNMFQVGPLLLRVAKVCEEVGTTLVLLHHTTKQAGVARMMVGEPLELEDLAYSGFQEFARQWLLVNRRQKYEPGSGKHLMWMNIGGSAGHSGCWGVDVEEGTLDDSFSSRRWQVQVRTMEDSLKGIVEAKEQRKENEKNAKKADIKEKVLKALETSPEGETQAAICKMLGLQNRIVGPILLELLKEQKVVRVQIMKASGQGQKPYDAWRLVTGNEFVAAKIVLMDAVSRKMEEARKSVFAGKGPLDDRNDTDWLDEEEEDESLA
jgi:replicative DNA helicase